MADTNLPQKFVRGYVEDATGRKFLDMTMTEHPDRAEEYRSFARRYINGGYKFAAKEDWPTFPVKIVVKDHDPNEDKCGYKAFYDGKETDIHANTLLEAKELAIKHFKVRKNKQHMVSIVLCEKPDGKTVFADPASLPG